MKPKVQSRLYAADVRKTYLVPTISRRLQLYIRSKVKPLLLAISIVYRASWPAKKARVMQETKLGEIRYQGDFAHIHIIIPATTAKWLERHAAEQKGSVGMLLRNWIRKIYDTRKKGE